MTVRIQQLLCLAMLAVAACNPQGLVPVDDTADPDTSDTDTDVAALLGILVTPERIVIPLGSTVQLTATGLLEDRSSLDVTAVASWGSANSSIAKVSDALDQEGTIEGLAIGRTEVYAEMNGVRSVPVKVTVTESTLLGLTVTPATMTANAGQTVQLRCEAAFSDGTRADASNQVIWSTDNGSVATMASGGKLTAVAIGSASVKAAWQGEESASVPVTVQASGQPDLRIAGITAESGPDDITLTVQLANDGNGGASDFWLDVFVDPPTAPVVGDLGDYYQPVIYADPGETLEASFNFQAEDGSHTIYVVADTENDVEESNESNNTGQTTVSVGSSEGAGPNLKITYFSYYADEEDVMYVIDVHNSGSEDVGQFYVDVWYDDATDPTDAPLGDWFTQVEGLLAGETEYADFLVSASEIGCTTCKSWAKADTNDNVSGETNEDDNTAGPITVVVPQL